MEKTRDRLIWLAIWLACLFPLAQLVFLLFANELGANPIEKLIRSLGEWALRFLLIGLTITPAAKLLRQPRLIRYRRMIGLWAFTYVTLHLSSYVVLDHFFDWPTIGKDIVKRPYITIGMAAFVMLIPLAITSWDRLRRKLGPRRWNALHRLIYLIAVFGVIHFYLLVKADRTAPLIYGALLAILLGYRAWAWARSPKRKPKRPARAQDLANQRIL
jgi:sulfoxide reductase heme-binding subunit YedZ